MVLTVLKGLGKAYLKGKSKKLMGVIKTEKGGVEAITGVAPNVSKDLSLKAKARRVSGFFDRMGSTLKTAKQEKITKAYKKWKKKK
jgi:high-affinity K+ transport system ATPase subunit B